VPTARRLFTVVLLILSSSALAPAGALATPGASPRCATGAAHSARRARNACRASARRSRLRRLARRRSHASAPGASAPTAGNASATSAAATIAAVLSTTCQNTELAPEPANLALVREAVLCLINRKRAENGERPLIPSPLLEEAAEGHCQELISVDYFAHVSPSGETPVDRIRDTGYIPSPDDGYVIGENLAWGTYQLATAQSIVSAWFASPEHLANILESQYRETGIAVTPAVPEAVGEGAPGATFAQEFGVIIP
jgi:uncharacterized protein YkwD